MRPLPPDNYEDLHNDNDSQFPEGVKIAVRLMVLAVLGWLAWENF